MSNDYDKWRRLHADLFGMHNPEDLRLFILWESRLERFTFDELRAASFAIAEDTSEKARFRTNHLSMLLANCLARRSEADARNREKQERQFAAATCEDCHGVGLVDVPHADFVRDGTLTRGFTMAVSCNCNVGLSRFNAINSRLNEAEAEHCLIDLTMYEARFPNWRDIKNNFREAEEREHIAIDLARRVDRSAPINVAAIAERMAKS